ncbi:MAG: ChaN family lipoprotein [Candidatus Cloacimonadota bacterium]|nr:ChaN family lipoprotein [Candidatus Cloacimonadota bacterium]
MKKFCSLLLLIISFFFLKAEYKIYTDSTEIKLPQLVDKLQAYDVIFFGEIHDDSLLHNIEFQLLKKMFEKDPRLCVSLEMFERDVQHLLNNYLQDQVSEKEFLQKSRPWPNYQTDYRPLVEFAKQNSLPVLAANVPRRYAALLNKHGKSVLDSLQAAEKEFIADSLVVTEGEYKERFLQTMASNMGLQQVSHIHHKMLESVYAAQCLKDDTMAESIANFIQKNPQTKVIHYNGEFHSDYHLGTAQKLKSMSPELKISVIATQPLSFGSELKLIDADKGDFIIVFHRKIKENQTKMPKFQYE